MTYLAASHPWCTQEGLTYLAASHPWCTQEGLTYLAASHPWCTQEGLTYLAASHPWCTQKTHSSDKVALCRLLLVLLDRSNSLIVLVNYQATWPLS